MRTTSRLLIALSVAAALAGRAAFADRAADRSEEDAAADLLRAHVTAVQSHVVGAAIQLGRGDRAAASAELGFAHDATRLAIPRASGGALRRDLRLARRRIAAAVAIVAAATEVDSTAEVRAVERAAAVAGTSLRRLGLRGTATCAIVEVSPGSASIHRPGTRARVRVLRRRGAALPLVMAQNDVAGVRALSAQTLYAGGGRYRVVWGPDLGGGAISVPCDGGRSLRAFNKGPQRSLAAAPPAALGYGTAPVFARVGGALAPVTPTLTGDAPFTFSSDTPLPDGLVLDPATGAISGTPTTEGPPGTFLVTARNVRSQTSAYVVVYVDPALPAGVTFLAGGFVIESLAVDDAVPVKMAWAPDGRLFFNELTTGNVRTLDADGALVAQPWATVPVLTGVERGLLGLAVAPDFATSGHVYVFASTAAGDGKPDRNRVLRFTGTGATGSGPEVIVDDLPIHATQNAGALAFGPDGRLYVTVGDTGNEVLAQTEGSLAGRVLRYLPDGSVPADNPFAGSPEWARGFRNPFALAFHPATGGLFATENGPAAHDELDFVQPGKNFEWGAAPDAALGSLRGIRIIDWTPVIVPTGIAFGTGVQFGPAYDGNLFLGGYDLADVRRIVLDGVDLVSEEEFVRFSEEGIDQKPLDLLVSPDGSLYVSTFTTIWRVRRN